MQTWIDRGARRRVHAPSLGLVVAIALPGCSGGGSRATPPGPTVSLPSLVATLADTADESWLASPAVADIDVDGTMEILAARHTEVVGWHLDGTVVFRVTTASRIWASPVVADLVPVIPGLEVAVAAGSRIYAWDATGAALPGFPYVFISELRSLAAGDIDGDGALELVSATTTPLNAGGHKDILIALNGDGSVVSPFPPNTNIGSGCDATCFVTGAYDQNLALGDVDGDTFADIVAPQDNAYVSAHRGDGFAFDAHAMFTGRTKVIGVRALLDYTQAQTSLPVDANVDLQGQFTNSAPLVADLTGDGIGELVVLSSVQNVAQTDRERGVALWVLHRDGTRPAAWTAPVHFATYLAGLDDFPSTNIVAATNSVAAGDLDAARTGPELVFAGFDGAIHAVDAQAQTLWSFTYTTDPRVLTGGVVLADLSQDGVPEVVFATYSPDAGKSALFVLDADGAGLHEVALPDRGAMAVPTIADCDGDGDLEIVVNLKDGVAAVRQVLVYTVAGSGTATLPWPTGRGSLRRDAWWR